MGKRVLITEVIKFVKKSDEELNEKIQQHIDSFGLKQTVEEWRADNYDILRKVAYPPLSEYIDAIVNKGIGNGTVGAASEQKYFTDCKAVKERFPNK